MIRTRIGRGNGGRVEVAEVETDGADDGDHDGGGEADGDGPEEGRALAGSPAAVLEGRCPEMRRGGHSGRDVYISEEARLGFLELKKGTLAEKEWTKSCVSRSGA